MVLLWPSVLALLVLIPALVAALCLSQKRKRRGALRYSSLSLLRPALPVRSRLRRWIPSALFMIALAMLIVAFTRPALVTNLPASRATLVLVIDVSPSMGQTDIQPSRLSAAEAAALSFIQQQEPTTQIGIVSFSGDAQLILPPTTDWSALKAAIKSLTLGQQTAIGSGILTGLETIARSEGQTKPPGNRSPNHNNAATSPIIVLLTDGVNNCCEPPLRAAQLATEQGVRIYTIGFGARQDLTQADDLEDSQRTLATASASGGHSRFEVDEQILKQIALKTGGKHYAASSASELQSVFASLPTRQVVKKEKQEISVIFTALGALLAFLAMLLSLRWSPFTGSNDQLL
jgi:Ca-activated chloride channel homolog